MKGKKKEVSTNTKIRRTPINYALNFGTPNEQFINIRPRIGSICKLYNVGDSTLIEFLIEKGYSNLSIHTSLTENALKIIKEEFIEFKNQKDKVRGVTEVNFIDNKLTKSSIESNAETEDVYESEPILCLANNIFQDIKKEIQYSNFPKLFTNFTDNQAIDVCSKLTSSFARNLCSKLNTSNGKRELILYQLHYIANKALKIFGGNILTFICQLRKLRFKTQTANEIKTYSKVIPDFPILSFKYSPSDSLKISFFLKRTNNNDLKPYIRVFSSKTFDEIGYLDERGYIHARLERFRPQLSMFCVAQQKNQLELFAGVENGYCDLCGKELTHPDSLRIGLGPVCAKNKIIDLDLSLYSFN